MLRALFLIGLWGVSACGRAGGNTAADAAPVAPDSASETGGRDWTRVDDALVQAGAQAGGVAFGLTIWDARDQRIHEHMEGGFRPDQRVAVASASKMISGLVIFDAIKRGELSLDSTTGEILGWTDANSAITLRHLLSFTSGLNRAALCTANPLITLARCVDTIRDAATVAAPGAVFDYGSTHLQVAARMAEVASGKSWAQLFTDTLATPLGLVADVAYFTAPKQMTGRLNPLIAGGLRASMNEYASMLALVFHRGVGANVTVGTPALFDAQAKEPFPDVTIGSSPVVDIGLSFRYGLTAWLLCDTPAQGCPSIASPGAFGFTPWVDRAAGYYAILGMELPRDTADAGVVDFAVKLQQQLAPLIAEQF